MDFDERATLDTEQEDVETREFTEDENRNQLRLYEDDVIKGLIAAADYHTEEVAHIEIVRNKVLYFRFDVHALGESEYARCRNKHTKFVRNKQLGLKLPEDTNTSKYRCAIIYQATAKEDREKLWDNKKVWAALEEKGLQVMNGLDVIEFCLMGGEKEMVVKTIDDLSGYDSDNLEEVAKN